MDIATLEKERQEKLVQLMVLAMRIISQRHGLEEITHVTEPDIPAESWAYEWPHLGAHIIQDSPPEGHVQWTEYEPNGRHRAPVVMHWSAFMNNGIALSTRKGGNQDWLYQLAIYDANKFLNYIEEIGVEGYHDFLSTVWSETHKTRIKHKKYQISSMLLKTEMVDLPKAGQ